MVGQLREDYGKWIDKGLSAEEAFNRVYSSYRMFDPTGVRLACLDQYKIGRDSLKHGAGYYNEIIKKN